MKKEEFLQRMGIESWELKNSAAHSDTQSPAKQVIEKNSVPETIQEHIIHDHRKQNFDVAAWAKLQAEVAQCKKCDLHKTRTNTVFGTGNYQADLMIIGEAPGADEDAQGKPFVGRAGQLLTLMLKSIGLDREQDVFIANILKSRPPNNRDPSPEEVRACTPFLQQQINLIQPKLLVALGRIAAHFLLNTDAALGQLRGKVHQYGEQGTPLLITYHPAYLLRSPGQKAKSYEDLRIVQELLKK